MEMLTYRKRFVLLLSLILFLICLNYYHHHLNSYLSLSVFENSEQDDQHAIIDRIQTISIGDENRTEERLFMPWIDRYNLSRFFDFFWYHTGGYRWHLRQMFDLIHISHDRSIRSFYSKYSFDDFYTHPEYGVIIDTATDPFLSIFPRLPQTYSTLKEICQRLEIIDHRCPYRRYIQRRDLLTYGLYNVIIGNPVFHRVHYDEIIYLYDEDQMNQITFISQIFPRLIRLISLVPQTAVILSPYFDRKIPYVREYIDLLVRYDLLQNGRRLLRLNPKRSYHAYVVYSTSTPRADLVILHSIFLTNRSLSDRKSILIIRNSLESKFFNELISIIHQFEPPRPLEIHEYYQQTFQLAQIIDIFSQAVIVIGQGNEIFSSIIWCLPGTQIVEIGQKNMSNAFFDISRQLKFDYWLGDGNDLNNWRHLFLKIFTHLQNL